MFNTTYDTLLVEALLESLVYLKWFNKLKINIIFYCEPFLYLRFHCLAIETKFLRRLARVTFNL